MKSSDKARLMTLHGVRKKVGNPIREIDPGATLDANKEQLESDTSLIVFVNFQTGDDSTGDGSQGNPFKNYIKGETEVNASAKTHVQWQTDDPIFDNITVPTQSALGVIGNLGFGDNWQNSTNNPFGTTATTDRINDVASDGSGNWVIVGNTGQIAFSTDNGDNWTNAATPSFGTTNITGITTDRTGNWLAVAGLKGAISTDNGDTWVQLATQPFGGTTTAQKIETDRLGNWVAIGGPVSAMSSHSDDNGATWTVSNDGDIATPADIATDRAGNWVIIGSDATDEQAFSTDNGLNWTVASGGVLAGFGFSITTDTNGTWLFANDNGDIYISTDNGDNWVVATTSSFGGNRVRGITSDESGKFIACGDIGKIAFSSDGDIWTQALSTNTTVNMFAVTTDGLGNFVCVGESGKIVFVGNLSIDADLSGFNLNNIIEITTDRTLVQCTNEPASGKAFVSTNFTILKKCKFISDDDDAIDIVNNKFTITNSFIQTKATGKRCVKITGAAAILGDIRFEFNTIIPLTTLEVAIEIDNASGGAGLEVIQNNLIEGGITATEQVVPFTMESGNIRGAADQGILIASRVSSSDPLFVSPTDFRLQRESGYADTDKFPFDSSLVAAAIDHTNAIINHLTTTSLVRDYGAFSFDDSNVSEQFTFSKEMDRPNGIKFKTINRAKVYAGVSGDYDIFNDVTRRAEMFTMTWDKGITFEDYSFFDFIEQQPDTSVFIILDPTELIAQPSVVVNGAHSKGDTVVNIISNNVFTGMSLELTEKQFVAYSLDSNNKKSVTNVVKLILAEPLREALIDTQIVNTTLPFGTGEYIYMAGENPGFSRQQDSRSDLIKGFSAKFIRKKP